MNSEIDGVKFLNPTHIANQNIINKMDEIRGYRSIPDSIKIQNNIHTIASYFTKGKSLKEMIDGLKHTHIIFIDEFLPIIAVPLPNALLRISTI